MLNTLHGQMMQVDEAISVLMSVRVILEIIEMQLTAPEHQEDARGLKESLTVYTPPSFRAT